MDRPSLNERAEPPAPPSAAPRAKEIGSDLKERASLRVLQEEKERKFRPEIYWYLSFRCNLACAHCSVNSSPWVDTSEDLTPEECMRVIDQMAELNVRIAKLTGGEFLLRPDALDIMRALGEKGIQVGIESNGLRFDEKFVEVARDLQSRNLFSIAISLDGGSKETHERLRGPRSFDRTMRGLRFLKENGISFHVQCVLNGSNYHTIPTLYEIATELSPEWAGMHWALLNPVGRGVELGKELGLQSKDINALLGLIKKSKPAYPGHTYVKMPPAAIPPPYLPMVMKSGDASCMTTCEFPLLGVLPNGDVSICAVSRDDESLNFGNVRDSELRLKDIWTKTRMDMLRSRYVEAQSLNGICGDCVWKYSCKGGCRAWAYEEGGDWDAPFPICQSLEEAGAFPKMYRLSHQNEVARRKYAEMNVGCGCSAA